MKIFITNLNLIWANEFSQSYVQYSNNFLVPNLNVVWGDDCHLSKFLKREKSGIAGWLPFSTTNSHIQTITIRWCCAISSTRHLITQPKISKRTQQDWVRWPISLGPVSTVSKKLAKWQVDKMTSWENGRQTKWQIDKMTSWQNAKLRKWHVDIMTHWQYDKKVKCHVNKMTSWKNDTLTKWQVGKITRWQFYRMTSWQNDTMTLQGEKLLKWQADKMAS